MSFYTDTRSALVARVLEGDAADYPMLHDNATLDNQTDTWLSVNFTPIANRSATQGRTGEDEASGFMQVNVNAPQGHGSIDGLTLADSILEQFERGSTLTYEDVTVVVEGATLAPSLFSEDGNTYITPITIDWRARRRRDADSYTPPPVLCPGPSELCQPPQFSSALSFNGVDQWGRTGQTIKPTDTEFHASMWIKPNESRTLRIFFSALQSSLYDIKLITGFDNTIVYGVDDGTQDVIETGISTTLNQWIEIYFGTTATEMYFRCPTLNIDLTAPANFDFTSITDGGVAVAARPDGSIGAQCQIAHASINGVGIPFNNVTPYDLTFATDEKTVVNYINDPVQTTQKVVHKEFEYGYFKAVRGDGATGAIDSGVAADVVTSIGVKFVMSDANIGRMIAGVVSLDPLYLTINQGSSSKIGIRTGTLGVSYSIENITDSVVKVEIFTNGDVYFNDQFHGNTGSTFATTSTPSVYFHARNGGTGSVNLPSPSIILQAWVNGNEIDIHDTNLHVGTISEHRLIDYP